MHTIALCMFALVMLWPLHNTNLPTLKNRIHIEDCTFLTVKEQQELLSRISGNDGLDLLEIKFAPSVN